MIVRIGFSGTRNHFFHIGWRPLQAGYVRKLHCTRAFFLGPNNTVDRTGSWYSSHARYTLSFSHVRKLLCTNFENTFFHRDFSVTNILSDGRFIFYGKLNLHSKNPLPWHRIKARSQPYWSLKRKSALGLEEHFAKRRFALSSWVSPLKRGTKIPGMWPILNIPISLRTWKTSKCRETPR